MPRSTAFPSGFGGAAIAPRCSTAATPTGTIAARGCGAGTTGSGAFPKPSSATATSFAPPRRGLRRLGRSGRPFFASIVSVSNHTPFRSREPALDIAGQDSLSTRILNTTRYTDDVLREFLEGLRGEPWFARTLIVIAGDHGFNTGEHGQPPGQHNLYRESVWVPLIIAGAHPRLPAGRHDAPATLLDISPTLADLLGLREANPWQGHSLLAVNEGGGTYFGFRDSLLAETPRWSAVRDPRDGQVRLYDNRGDWLQRAELRARHPEVADRADRPRRTGAPAQRLSASSGPDLAPERVVTILEARDLARGVEPFLGQLARRQRHSALPDRPSREGRSAGPPAPSDRPRRRGSRSRRRRWLRGFRNGSCRPPAATPPPLRAAPSADLRHRRPAR